MSLVARLSLVAAVLSGAVLVVLPAAALAADTYHVDVVDDAYDDRNRDGNADEENEDPNRDHTVITAGDAVVWQWNEANEHQHTVTSRVDAPVQFDSDSECEEDKTECRSPENIFVFRFEEPGTYTYYCKVHSPGTGFGPGDMTGTIEVRPAPEPSESDDGGSEPSSEPASEEASSEPEPSESGSSEPREEPSETSTPDDAASGTEDDPTTEPDTADDRPPRRQATRPGFGVQREPRADPSGGPGPQVAPEAGPSPSFSPFPTAPDPSDAEAEDLSVTVPGRDGGGPSRGLVVGVAVASLLGSAGAFGKVVLFGRPWG